MTICPTCGLRCPVERGVEEWWLDHQPTCAGSYDGRRLRDEGKDLVESHNGEFMETIRKVARSIARQQGRVTVDELRGWAKQNGLAPKHQNAWGAVFRGAEWEEIGEQPSSFVTNHARRVRVWRLK